MSKLSHRVNDFIALFNAFWYRDFPLSELYNKTGNRAGWTAHIGAVVKSSADLLGLFTYFETGSRTDAIIKNNQEREIAHLEWEWWQPFNEKVNEIQKLHSRRKDAEFSVFFSYSRRDRHPENIKSIRKQWKNSIHPLIVFLVTFDYSKRRRWFYDLETYLVQNGKMRRVRKQPALPWDVPGTRWESNNKSPQ